MQVILREYQESDLEDMVKIWNEVVIDGIAYPQLETLTIDTARKFFSEQSYTCVACDEADDRPVGLYILHPNNIGRCGHIANASYAVLSTCRDSHIGEKLVSDSLQMGKKLGFRILQFNAVVESNLRARHLYEKLGFVPLGVIPGGFKMDDGHYENICPYYHEL